MSKKSNATKAKDAVKTALEASQAVAQASADADIDLLQEVASNAIDDAVKAATKAKTLEEHQQSIDAARAMLSPLSSEDIVAVADAAAEREVKRAEAAKVAAAEAAKVPFHTIADGKALTTRRGILGPGDKIVPEDLPGGGDALKDFVTSGHVNAPEK